MKRQLIKIGQYYKVTYEFVVRTKANRAIATYHAPMVFKVVGRKSNHVWEVQHMELGVVHIATTKTLRQKEVELLPKAKAILQYGT